MIEDIVQTLASADRGKTYGRLTFSKANRQWMLSDIPPHIAIKLKSIFPIIPKTQVGVFTLPYTDLVSTDLEWFNDRYPMRMSIEDARMLVEARARHERGQNELAQILSGDWSPSTKIEFKPGMELYPYQAQAVEFVARLNRLLLMDDLGLGKSVSALGAIVKTRQLPAAIVVQSHLPSQWVNEFIKKFTYLTVHVIKTVAPYTLPPADVYIFKYSQLAGWVDVAATGFFKTVVYDEIQELRRGNEAQKGKAAKVFTGAAVIRIGLSATPVFNYGSEAFNIVEAIEPGALGEWSEFIREWCTSSGTKWIVKDPDSLGSFLRDQNIALRRERAGRPINTIKVEVDYDEEVERDSYDLARKLALKVTSGSFSERGQAARELDLLARQITGVAKAKPVAAYVRMLVEAGQPVLLAAWHREVYDIWLKDLADLNPMLYTGTESASQKDKTKKAFIDGETDLMIISLRSGAGIDGLQKRCSTVVFGELDWSPSVLAQCVGRVDRPGQKNEVTAIYLWTNSGSDPLILNMLGLKASQARGIVDPLKGVGEVYTDESRIKLLAERYLEKRGMAA